MVQAWLAFSTYVFFDILQGVSIAALVVAGRQVLGGLITWIGYFVIMTGLLCYSVFARDASLPSLWTNATLGVAFVAICFIYVANKTDWAQISEEAAKKRQVALERLDQQSSKVE